MGSWDGALLQDFVEHGSARPRDESHLADRPAIIQRRVEVATIDCHDATRCKRERLGNPHRVGVAVGHEGPPGQAALVIQLQMERDRALRPQEPSPIEHGGTELTDRRIQRPEWMREPEPAALQGRHGLTPDEDLIEEGLVHLPGPMRIGIHQRGASRRPSAPRIQRTRRRRGMPSSSISMPCLPDRVRSSWSGQAKLGPLH